MSALDASVEMACGAVAQNAPGACVLDVGHLVRGEQHRDAEGLTWKYEFKYGRPDIYEITWMTGHVETVVAHQVTYPHSGLAFASRAIGMANEPGAPRIRMHAEIDGRWTLTLAAREEDIRTMRLVTNGESILGGES